MDVSFFIASRLRFKGKIITAAISISFLVMIIAVAVSSGFRNEVRKGISTLNGDVQLTSPDLNVLKSSPIDGNPSYLGEVMELEGVESVIPAVYKAGIVKEDSQIHGVLFKGLPREDITYMSKDDSTLLAVAIPSRLAELSGLKTGDKMLTYFIGEKVRLRQFNVVSVYDELLEADNRMMVYADMSDLQRLEGWNEDDVSALEVIVSSDCRDEDRLREITSEIGFMASVYSEDSDRPVVAYSAVSRYRQLFDWLDLIDFNVVFILILMTLVAGFNMISGLLIMLFENISTIGLLKSLGMTDRGIAKTFLSSSAVLMLKGMFIGNLTAFAFCLIQGTTHILKLDPENYFVSFVPVHLDMGLILAADLVAFTVIMLLLLIPCLFISRVDPSETVRVR
ncbi:MAG: ABC transporter permease [Bacteroidales bacterium]|nr:ABC transporter permease [Bacteroidales bacterium]